MIFIALLFTLSEDAKVFLILPILVLVVIFTFRLWLKLPTIKFISDEEKIRQLLESKGNILISIREVHSKEWHKRPQFASDEDGLLSSFGISYKYELKVRGVGRVKYKIITLREKGGKNNLEMWVKINQNDRFSVPTYEMQRPLKS